MPGKTVKVPLIGAVDFVSHNREARLAQVHADLVLSPRLRPGSQERNPCPLPPKPFNPLELAPPRVPPGHGERPRASHLLTAFRARRITLDALRWGRALADGQVFLVDLPFGESARQPPRGFGLAPAKQNARGLAVEPMKRNHRRLRS